MKCAVAGLAGEHFQGFFAVFFAAVVEGAAHHDFLAFAVNFFVEKEFGIFARLVNGPARQALGHLNHVLLGVAGVHADGVEFHHFPAVIFIQAALGFLGGGDVDSPPEGRWWLVLETCREWAWSRRRTRLDSARGENFSALPWRATAAGSALK